MPNFCKKTFLFQGEVVIIMLVMWKISSFFTSISLEWLWRTISNTCCCCGCWKRREKKALNSSLAATAITSSALHKDSLSFPKRKSSFGWEYKKNPTPPPPSLLPFPSVKLFLLLHQTLSTVAWLSHLVVVSVHCLTHPYFPPIFLHLPLLFSSSPASRDFSG